MALIFEWDPAKDTANRRKHGVGFDEAMTVLAILSQECGPIHVIRRVKIDS